jgi:hypothetical protein
MKQQVKGSFEVSRSMQPACDLGSGVEAARVRFDSAVCVAAPGEAERFARCAGEYV